MLRPDESCYTSQRTIYTDSMFVSADSAILLMNAMPYCFNIASLQYFRRPGMRLLTSAVFDPESFQNLTSLRELPKLKHCSYSGKNLNTFIFSLYTILGKTMCNFFHPISHVLINCTGEEDVEIVPCGSFGLSEVRLLLQTIILTKFQCKANAFSCGARTCREQKQS